MHFCPDHFLFLSEAWESLDFSALSLSPRRRARGARPSNFPFQPRRGLFPSSPSLAPDTCERWSLAGALFRKSFLPFPLEADFSQDPPSMDLFEDSSVYSSAGPLPRT